MKRKLKSHNLPLWHWSLSKKKEAVLEKLKQSRLGSKLSQETKTKMSLAKKGKLPANHAAALELAHIANRKIRVCKGCGVKFVAKQGGGTVYHSRGCYIKHFHPTVPAPRYGKDHHNWKGGVTKPNHALRDTVQYKTWRKEVFERDNYTCQRCGKRGGDLEAHHKLPFASHPELRFDVSNGETLCVYCHKQPGLHSPKPSGHF